MPPEPVICLSSLLCIVTCELLVLSIVNTLLQANVCPCSVGPISDLMCYPLMCAQSVRDKFAVHQWRGVVCAISAESKFKCRLDNVVVCAL